MSIRPTFPDPKYIEIKGGSHGITRTRADEINAELVKFIG